MTRVFPLGELITIERGVTYKSEFLDQPGPVLLGLGTIQRHGGFRADSLRTYGGASPAKLLVQPGEIYASLKDVTQTADLLGAVARLPHAGPVGRLTQDTVRLDLKASEVTSEYLYWMLRTPQYRSYCRSHATGTTTMGLPRSDFFAFEVPAPTEERSQLVALLEAIDDKIGANERICGLVDGLLRSKFAGLADGRGSAELRHIARVNVEQAKPKPGQTLRYLDISAVGQGVYEFPPESSWDDAPGRARRLVRQGDSVWSTVRPNRRSHALILDDDSRLVASTGLAVLSPRPGRVAGVYEATRTSHFVAYLESVAEGSAYPAVRSDRFGSAPIPELQDSEWDAFEAEALPLRRRSHAAARESRTLAALRDGLLSRLMSGKVRMRDAEKVVEGVA